MRPGRAGLCLPLLWLSSPKHEQRHQRTEHKNRKHRAPRPDEQTQAGLAETKPGAASRAWEALGAGFAGTCPPARRPSPGVQRAQAVRTRRRRFQGRLPGPQGLHGPPPASLSQALDPDESLRSHLFQPPGSRAGSAVTEQKTKAAEKEILPRKAVRAPGSRLGGSATPARQLQDESPRPDREHFSRRSAARTRHPAPQALEAPRRAVPRRRLRPAKVLPVPRPGRRKQNGSCRSSASPPNKQHP